MSFQVDGDETRAPRDQDVGIRRRRMEAVEEPKGGERAQDGLVGGAEAGEENK
jgi:hypothetical protein